MDTDRITDLLAPFFRDAQLSPEQLGQLSAYLDLLLRWNARINLTAVRFPEDIVTRHFGESLFAARALYPAPQAARLIDVGSGAGFPGLPIKVWSPSLTITLIEAQYRKAIFIREACRVMNLADVEVFPGRAEDYSPDPASSDHSITVTLRAVERFERALPVAARLLAGFASPGRDLRLALMIGESQLAGARVLLPDFSWTDPLSIPQSQSRVLLIGSAPR